MGQRRDLWIAERELVGIFMALVFGEQAATNDTSKKIAYPLLQNRDHQKKSEAAQLSTNK